MTSLLDPFHTVADSAASAGTFRTGYLPSISHSR